MEYVNFESQKANLPQYQYRYRYIHLFDGGRINGLTKLIDGIFNIPQRIFRVNASNKSVQYYKGDQWFSITHDFASYIVQNRSKAEKLFRWSVCPDEMLIQTLLMESPYATNTATEFFKNNIRAIYREIDWKRGNPYIWREVDIDYLTRSNAVFARKFDINIDLKVVDWICDYVKE